MVVSPLSYSRTARTPLRRRLGAAAGLAAASLAFLFVLAVAFGFISG